MDLEMNKNTELTYQKTEIKETHRFVFRTGKSEEKTIVAEVTKIEEKCFYPFEEYFHHITEMKIYDKQNSHTGYSIQNNFNDFNRTFEKVAKQMFVDEYENEEIKEQVNDAIDYLQDEYGLI